MILLDNDLGVSRIGKTILIRQFLACYPALLKLKPHQNHTKITWPFLLKLNVMLESLAY